MSYIPPELDAVNLELEEYTVPDGDAVNFDLQDEPDINYHNLRRKLLMR